MVKLGRASGALVLCTTLNAATGLLRPLSSRFPRSSNLTTASTASAMWLRRRKLHDIVNVIELPPLHYACEAGGDIGI